MLLLYNILLFIVSLFAIPYYGLKMLFTGKYRHSLGPIFGINRPDLYQDMKGKPRVWIHAVSVGEVTAAAPIIASLQSDFPGACIVLSTSTETGQAMARRIVPASVHLIYYPLDIPFVIRKVVRQIQPDIFIPTETELWPNFLRISKRQGIKIVMINGRLSPGPSGNITVHVFSGSSSWQISMKWVLFQKLMASGLARSEWPRRRFMCSEMQNMTAWRQWYHLSYGRISPIA